MSNLCTVRVLYACSFETGMGWHVMMMPEKMADRVTQLQDAINQVRDGSPGEESSK